MNLKCSCESHANGKVVGPSPITRDLAAQDGPCGNIHVELDVGFDFPDFYVGLICVKAALPS